MARMKPLFIGVGGHVVAVDPTTGAEIWRSKLKGTASYVTVCHVASHVYAGANGELFCLDAATGTQLWHNKLKGLGLGIVAFPGSDPSVQAAAAAAQAAASGAAAS